MGQHSGRGSANFSRLLEPVLRVAGSDREMQSVFNAKVRHQIRFGKWNDSEGRRSGRFKRDHRSHDEQRHQERAGDGQELAWSVSARDWHGPKQACQVDVWRVQVGDVESAEASTGVRGPDAGNLEALGRLEERIKEAGNGNLERIREAVNACWEEVHPGGIQPANGD